LWIFGFLVRKIPIADERENLSKQNDSSSTNETSLHESSNSTSNFANESNHRSIPLVVRTKKAEKRMLAASPSPIPPGEPLNSVEERALELQKRQEWRQARYKSLEADSAAAEQVMKQVQQINSRLNNISEEPSSGMLLHSPKEKILQNETSIERNEYIDPVTGAATISLVERSVTQREVFS
uniref:EHBP1 n=1 Tax=Syphacia muris TaxID=451379 RepID=A0A0N5AAW3_9BILA